MTIPSIIQILAFFFLTRRGIFLLAAGLILAVLVYNTYSINRYSTLRNTFHDHARPLVSLGSELDDGKFHWRNLPIHFPVTSLIPLPNGRPAEIPKIQHQAAREREDEKKVRLQRQNAVREAFQHAWNGYKTHAWMADEVGPLSGMPRNSFGGWAASLVDALDTLWIMGMKEDFESAVNATATVDFTKSDEKFLNTFETTIRYLGGFLGAYDISNAQYPQLLTKAMELGEMLLVAFDTPNRMPITRWDWRKAANGEQQQADTTVLVAEIGSLTLEFTRLSQLTGDVRFYDAVQRVIDRFDEHQSNTQLPGMWPIVINARDLDFNGDNAFTLGAMADSTYEYLPKQHLLLGARTNQYQKMYDHAAEVFRTHNFYRPMTRDNADILFSGLVRANGNAKSPSLDNSMQHLVCFAGGMVAIAAKVFDRPDDLAIAERLVGGCIWAYDSMDSGLMTEVSHHVACPADNCAWNETLWHEAIMQRESDEDRASNIPYEERLRRKIEDEKLPPGYTSIDDRRYILRPEAVESVLIWYRISGDKAYQDHAWRMFQNIEKHTRTDIANAALDDVTTAPPAKADRMESFWMAETLKYLYLTFADPDTVSLDEYVFNTEAHPFRRPQR